MSVRRAQLLAGVALPAALVAAWLVSPAAVAMRLSWLAADPTRFGAALLALAVVRPLFLWPTTLLALGAGYGYGVAGAPVALVLIVLTSVPPYLLARRLRSGGRLSAAGARLVDATGDLRSVTASRLLPAPSDVVSAAAGVAGVPLGAFIAGTALGEVPWAVAGAFAGASAASLDGASLSSAVDWRLFVATALAGLLLLARPTYRYVVGAGGRIGADVGE